MTTNHPGWKPEGFTRKSLTIEDIDAVLQRVRERIESHFRDYGDGIFLHPHEIVGCMFGQQMKLSTAADASIYTGDLDAFEERCYKTLLAIIVGTTSVNKLKELKS
jgi:hypothetical protein